MSLKEYEIDIFTGIKHRIGTKRHSNYRGKLEKELKKYSLEELKKKIKEKNKLDIDCIKPCKEDEICNRKSGKCIKKSSNLGISILRKMNENLLKEFRPELWDIIKMPMDNHCGYHGFIYAYKSLIKDYSKLDFNQPLKDLILELKSILIQYYKEKEDGINYNRILNNSNNWLEDIDLQVFANYFNIIIIMYDERMNPYKKNLFTEISPTPIRGQLEKIYLFQTVNHYDVMMPKNIERNIDIEQPKDIIITDDCLKSYLREKGILIEDYNIREDPMIEDEDEDLFGIDKEEIEEENIPSNEEESILLSKTNSFRINIISRKILSNDEIKSILKEKINKKKIDKLKNFLK